MEEIVDSIKSYEGNLTSKVEKSRPQPELIVISESVCERDVKPVLYKLDPMVVEEADMEDEDNLVFEMSYSQAEEVVRSRIILDAHQNSCMWEMCGIQCDSPADLFEHIKEIHVDPSPPVSVGGGFYCCINNCPVPDRKFTKR